MPVAGSARRSRPRTVFARRSRGQRDDRSFRGYGELVKDPKQLLDLPRGLQVPHSLGRERADEIRRRRAVAARRHGGVRRAERQTVLVRNHELNPDDVEEDGATPVRTSPNATYDPEPRGRHDDAARRRRSPARQALGQPGGHADELRRRPDAVGHVAHVRGRVRHARQAAWLRVRGRSRPRRQPAADRRHGPLRARGRLVRSPRHRVPDRGRRRARSAASIASCRTGRSAAAAACTRAESCRRSPCRDSATISRSCRTSAWC